MTGSGMGGMSGGTRASTAGVMLEPGFAFRGGRIVTEPAARRSRASTSAAASARPSRSAPPSTSRCRRSAPGLTDVDGLPRLVRDAVAADAGRLDRAVGDRPDRAAQERSRRADRERSSRARPAGRAQPERATGGSYVVARALGADETELVEVRVGGVDGYTFTARFLAWSAIATADGGMTASGALGPVGRLRPRAIRAGRRRGRHRTGVSDLARPSACWRPSALGAAVGRPPCQLRLLRGRDRRSRWPGSAARSATVVAAVAAPRPRPLRRCGLGARCPGRRPRRRARADRGSTRRRCGRGDR